MLNYRSKICARNQSIRNVRICISLHELSPRQLYRVLLSITKLFQVLSLNTPCYHFHNMPLFDHIYQALLQNMPYKTFIIMTKKTCFANHIPNVS